MTLPSSDRRATSPASSPDMTKIERTCPRCGLVFASDKLDGLCPACLLNSLFGAAEAEDASVFWEEEEEAPAKAVSEPATTRRFSHFDLLEELGRGGMGVVYRARDLGTGRIIALKVLQAHHLEVPDLVLRFRSEVRAVTSLDHPHVLPVHEVGEYEGIPFFSMKLTTGGSLAQRVGDYLGKPTEIARLMAKVARGVAHAHERGILHRDLKPGNILLDAAGEPYVCDFGLAKWIEDDRNLTITSAVLGTPHYIAPEQARGQKGLTTAADIYSLGAIVYELLTARPPFVGQSIIETLRLASENTPERPSSLAQNIPKDLETICLKCLEREPASRYPSAAALATDLENWLDGRPIMARPVGAAEQLWRWARRNPLPASLIASVAMLLVATAVVATWSAIRIEKARDRAVAAEAESREKLYESLLAQARASLLTGQSGQSLDALAALKDAAKIHPTLDVRNLAIRALSLSDIKAGSAPWKIGPNGRPSRSFDSKIERIAEEVGRGVIRILRLADGKELQRFDDQSASDANRTSIDRILFSPDDRLLAARRSDGSLSVWNVSTGKKLYQLACAPIAKAPWYAPNFVFSNHGTLLACVMADGRIAIHNSDTGQEEARLPSTEVMRCLAFSSDDRFLASAVYDDRPLTIWDLASGRAIRQLAVPAPAYSIAWSPDDEEIAVGSFDYNIYLFDAQNGRRTGTFSGHRAEVTQVLFTPAGDHLISTGIDKTVRLWSLSALTQEVVINSYGSEPAMHFSPNGRDFAVTSAGSTAHLLTIHDASAICRTYVNGRAIGRATLVGGLALSADGQRAATATYEGIDVWDLKAGRHFGTYDIDPDTEKSVRFGDDSQTLLVGSRKSGLVEYRIAGNRGNSHLEKMRVLDAEPGFIFSNSQTGNPDWIEMTSSSDGIARLFDLRQRRDVFKLSGLPEVWDMAVSPDRRFFTLSFSAQAPAGQGNTQVWSLPSLRKVATLPGGQFGTARFSHDGKWLKISGRGEVDHLFSSADWAIAPRVSIEGSNPLFSPTDMWAATNSAELIRLWNMSGGSFGTLESQLVRGRGFRLACDLSGEHLVGLSTDNILLVWNLKLLSQRLGMVFPNSHFL